MREHHDDLFMAMTDATGGALGGNANEGADASDAGDAEAGGDHTRDDGDFTDAAGGNRDRGGDAEREGEDEDEADGPAAEGDDKPYPGYVSDETLAQPGPIDVLEIENARTGAGPVRDLGIDTRLREEMLDNAVAYGLGDAPENVNDERAFDDGLPGSWSDFDPVSPDAPEGTTRFADPNDDAGGEIKGPRHHAGAGGFDGGPTRTAPLPGEDDGA